MRSLKRRFEKIKKESAPCISSYTVFSKAIRNQNFSPRTIAKYFNELVDRNDYDKKDKKEIIKHLLNL